jgi:centromere protein C
VELPPKGVKKPKNSKRMHMVFYVCHGRVQVDISGIQFSAGKGCVFQVPRGKSYVLFNFLTIGFINPRVLFPGNYYSFANIHSKEVRLFFTQGQLPEEEEENDTQATTPEAGTESENEAETASAAPASPSVKKGRGRPRGRKNDRQPPTPEAGTENENEAEAASAAPASPPVKKGKGRPRGKQKKSSK